MIDGDRASAVHQEIDGGRDPHRREFRGRGPRPNDDGRLSTPGPRIQFAPLNFRKTIRERFPAVDLPMAAAAQMEEGHGGLYALVWGEPVLPKQSTAVWLTRPRGIQWRTTLDALQLPGTTLWRRQMVLGPGKEFALIVTSSPRHRIAMLPSRAVVSEMGKGSAFMSVLLSRVATPLARRRRDRMRRARKCHAFPKRLGATIIL